MLDIYGRSYLTYFVIQFILMESLFPFIVIVLGYKTIFDIKDNKRAPNHWI